VINRRFPYLHIAFILLLSIVFIPPAFAIEARYVKVLIDGTNKPANYNCAGMISIAEIEVIDSSGANVSSHKPSTAFSDGNLDVFCNYVPYLYFSYRNYSEQAFDSHIFDGIFYPLFNQFIHSTPYYASTKQYPLGTEWIMVDLQQVFDIKQVLLYTLDAPLLEPDTFTSGWASSLTDYRIAVSIDNLNWTLAAVVTNAAGTTRTDTITLEDLGGGMDIDINYVVALFLAIIILGFFRQIFF